MLNVFSILAAFTQQRAVVRKKLGWFMVPMRGG
jgi:hypothetical protein